MLSRYLSTAALAVVLPLALPQTGWSQKWEVGGMAGGAFNKDATAESPAGAGKVGLKNGAIFSAFLGNNMYRLVAGELRYEYRLGDLKVSSGGTDATLAAQTHAIHYDFLFHFAPTGSKARPYVFGGGGVMIFRGTGTESPAQPLSRIALLTKTNETKGLGTFGAGIKVQVGNSAQVRFELRNYVTPFPRQVIAPSVGATIGDIYWDIAPMGGIAFTF
ncbi:MAG: outer membrane beta-barrel protein [Bryobacteraceae bacterium]